MNVAHYEARFLSLRRGGGGWRGGRGGGRGKRSQHVPKGIGSRRLACVYGQRRLLSLSIYLSIYLSLSRDDFGRPGRWPRFSIYRSISPPTTGPWSCAHDGVGLGLHTDVSPPRKTRRRPYARAASCAARAIPASCGLARRATRLCLGCCRAACVAGTSNTSTHAHGPVTDSATIVSAHARAPAPATLAICGGGAWRYSVQGGSRRRHRR